MRDGEGRPGPGARPADDKPWSRIRTIRKAGQSGGERPPMRRSHSEHGGEPHPESSAPSPEPKAPTAPFVDGDFDEEDGDDDDDDEEPAPPAPKRAPSAPWEDRDEGGLEAAGRRRRLRTSFWERRGRVWIAVPAVDRRRVAETVPAGEDAAAARVFRVRARDLERAVKARPEAETLRQAQLTTLPPLDARLSEGRAGLAVDEELARLFAQRVELAATAPSLDEVRQALLRLAVHEQERWMGLRNGSARALRPPARPPVEALLAAVTAARRADDPPEVTRALERGRELTADAALYWNFAAQARRPEWIAECGAEPTSLFDKLPATSPLDLPVPAEVAASLLPVVASWQVQRLLLGAEAADPQALASLRSVGAELFAPGLRNALWELAGRLERAAPPPSDLSGWQEVALATLRKLLSDPPPALENAVARAAEPAGYARAAQLLLDQGHPWLAEWAARAGAQVQGDHRRSLQVADAARAAREANGDWLLEVQDSAGVGRVALTRGAAGRWEVQWRANESWPDDTDIARLSIPDNLRFVLQENGYTTVGQLRNAEPAALFGLPGVGRAGYRLLRSAIAAP
jgi:hypothetical protein